MFNQVYHNLAKPDAQMAKNDPKVSPAAGGSSTEVSAAAEKAVENKKDASKHEEVEVEEKPKDKERSSKEIINVSIDSEQA